MKKSVVGVCVLAVVLFASLIVFPSQSPAVMLQVDASGELTGALEVDVLGTKYDVKFVEGSCVGLFGGCDNPAEDFTFTSNSEVSAAGQALIDQVLIDGPDGNFDTNPGLTFGIASDAPWGEIMIPWELDVHLPDVTTRNVENRPVDTDDNDYTLWFDVNADTHGYAGLVYAEWTVSQAQVPEPSSLLLLSSGLIGIGFIRRKLKMR